MVLGLATPGGMEGTISKTMPLHLACIVLWEEQGNWIVAFAQFEGGEIIMVE